MIYRFESWLWFFETNDRYSSIGNVTSSSTGPEILLYVYFKTVTMIWNEITESINIIIFVGIVQIKMLLRRVRRDRICIHVLVYVMQQSNIYRGVCWYIDVLHINVHKHIFNGVNCTFKYSAYNYLFHFPTYFYRWKIFIPLPLNHMGEWKSELLLSVYLSTSLRRRLWKYFICIIFLEDKWNSELIFVTVTKCKPFPT